MPDRITVTVTDRISAIDEALTLVHDGFVESGFMRPQRARRRVIPQYFNPGTFFAVAYIAGRPAGALVSVPDGPFGLPSEAVYPEEFSRIRATGVPIETGSLAIAPAARAHKRRLLTMLFAAQVRIGLTRPEYIVSITVAPEQERFYRAFANMRRVGTERDLYGYPAVLLAAPVTEMAEWASSGTSVLRRTAHRLYTESDPSWLTLDLPVGMSAPPSEEALLERVGFPLLFSEETVSA